MGSAIRIAHLSDLHIGYKSGRRSNDRHVNIRVQDGYNLLSTIVSQVIESDVDLVVIAGDMFHTPKPSIMDICVVQDELRRFARASIPVYLLAGNHEAVDDVSEVASSRVLHDPDRSIFSHIEPYAVHEVADGVFLHMVSHHMYMDQGATMKDVRAVPGAVNIFTTHGSVIDPVMKIRLHTEQSPREIVIPDGLLIDQGWSAAMLGHIHERSEVHPSYGRNVYYNGSSLRRGFADKDNGRGRGWTLWEFDASGLVSSRTPVSLAQRPQFDFSPIDASGLTASQLTDLVVENLRSTQAHGTSFDERDAPIIRQRVTGVSLAQMGALDSNLINEESAHALAWSLVPSYAATDTPKGSTNADAEPSAGTAPRASGLVPAFDDWSATAPSVSQVAEEMREAVLRQSRDFIKMGQDQVLDSAASA